MMTDKRSVPAKVKVSPVALMASVRALCLTTATSSSSL